MSVNLTPFLARTLKEFKAVNWGEKGHLTEVIMRLKGQSVGIPLPKIGLIVVLFDEPPGKKERALQVVVAFDFHIYL